MKRLFLASITMVLSSCSTLPPIVLSGRYTLPGGKGVVSFYVPLPTGPVGEHDASLFPDITNQK